MVRASTLRRASSQSDFAALIDAASTSTILGAIEIQSVACLIRPEFYQRLRAKTASEKPLYCQCSPIRTAPSFDGNL